ncbi:MAG TPA: amidohydrolase family protein [Candidatus Acidoferrales bacterium]|nr:amidohydrolase family protein [Candidatus Acidoferrales bacterium]
MPKKSESGIPRRDFIKTTGAGALSVGLGSFFLGEAASSVEEKVGPPKADSTRMTGKIAMEEHFTLPESTEAGYAELRDVSNLRLKLLDVGSGRIAEMDRCGLEICILSHNGPAIQAIPEVLQAIATSRRTNDYLAEHIAKYPKRLKGFAALPLQDPQAAAQELTRCVKELGLCGALVNGYSQIGKADSAVYYDLPEYRPFWATVEKLDVPLYLHPRSPLESRQQDYEGHPWLLGAVWGFAAETSIHALRLMGSGLFDEYPKLKVILGHLGEGLPFNIWRVDHRISKLTHGTKAKLPVGQYLRENFYITTSGNFRTQALTDVILEVGADRVLYSVDYPFEDMAEAADWFDHAAISEPDRLKIGRTNAQMLFHL